MASPGSSERRGGLRRLGPAAALLVVAALAPPACGIDKLVSSPGQDDGSGNGSGNQQILSLAFVVQPGNTEAEDDIRPPIQLAIRDQTGTVVSAFTGKVTLEIAANPGGGTLKGTTQRDADDGLVAFNNLSIDEPGDGYTLRATASGVNAATSATFNITRQRPGDDRVIAAVSGGGQSDTVAATLSEPYVVEVRDQSGTPVPGVTVSFAVTSGGGSLTTETVTTDAAGRAETFHRLGTTTGAQTVAARLDGAQGSPLGFSATALHGAAARIVFLQQPSDSPSGADIAPPVQVRLVDQFDNPATGFAGAVDVSLTPLTGTPAATLSGTLAQPAVSGHATFADLRISLPGLGYRLRMTSGGLTTDSAPFTIL